MAKLEYLHHWARYVPDIGDNRSLEKPFFLEVATGLSINGLLSISAGLDELQGKQMDRPTLAAKAAEVLAPAVRFGSEPLELGERRVTTLAEYIDLVLEHVGALGYREIVEAISRHNSIEETHRLFSERHSGGTASTPAQSAAKAGNPTAAP